MWQIKHQALLCSMSLVLVLCGLAGLCVFYVDKSLALAIHSHTYDRWLWLRNISENMPFLITVIVLVLVLNAWHRHKKWPDLLLIPYFYVTLQATMLLKTGLKICFGRYWPQTWIAHNLSLIHDNVYGFNWGQGVANQGSFPSGHATYITFCVVWLGLLSPRWHRFWLLLVALEVTSLVLLNYHFLGDCLAGLGLGLGCALCSIVGWQALKARCSSFKHS